MQLHATQARHMHVGDQAEGVINAALMTLACVIDLVTHSRQIITLKGEPTRDKQALSIVFSKVRAPLGTVETAEMRPGPLTKS